MKKRWQRKDSVISRRSFHWMESVVFLRYGKQLFVSYGVTIFVTVAGTALGLLL